ncbi:MAG: 4-carboxymuconolactone decarboxylase [Verrucomicrobiales bacterium]
MTSSRLPRLTRDVLDPDQLRVFDAIAGGDRAKDGSFPLTDRDGALVGPFNALLFSPNVGDAIQQVGAALRFHCGLEPAVRELAILVVATHHDSEFERWAHESIALRVGLSDEQVAALRAGTRPEFDSDELTVVYNLCAATVAGGLVDDLTYRQASDTLGNEGVVELITVLGYYGLLAQLMNVFEVGLPEL